MVNRYKEDGFEFLLEAFNDATFLEKVSGLEELQVDPLGLEVNSINVISCEASIIMFYAL